MKIIIITVIISLLIINCEKQKYPEWYRQYKVEIVYNNCYVDTLYQISQTSGYITTFYYTNKDSQKVELPNNCIKTILKEFPNPKLKQIAK